MQHKFFVALGSHYYVSVRVIFHLAEFLGGTLIDDSAKGGLVDRNSILGTFYHDSLRAKIFKTLIRSLLEGI